MCKICGEPSGVHPHIDEMFEDMPESMADSLNCLAEVFQTRVENGISEDVVLAASMLIGVLRHPEMPVPAIMTTDRGALVLDWRQNNRLLEVEIEADGRTIEFLVGQVEPPADGDVDNVAQLVAQVGGFLIDDIKNLPEGDRGPGPIADWLVGGEFIESLDRYIYTEDPEDICLDSEPGFEPTNITNLD